MTIAAGILERRVGLDSSIYDFISRNSSGELRRDAARGKSRVKSDSDSLKGLIESKDAEALDEKVSEIIADGSKEGIAAVLKNYLEIAMLSRFSKKQVKAIAEQAIRYELAEYSEGKFIRDFIEKCDDRSLVKRMADYLIRKDTRDNSAVIAMYESIGDEEGLAGCAANVPLEHAINILEKIKNPKIKDSAVRHLLNPDFSETSGFLVLSSALMQRGKSSFIGYLLKNGYEKEAEIFIGKLAKAKEFSEEWEVAAVCNAYAALKRHFNSAKDSKRIDAKLEDIAISCISSGSYDAFEHIMPSYFYTNGFRKRILEHADSLLRKLVIEGTVRLEKGNISGFDAIDRFYFYAGYGYGKSDRRAGDICFNIGRYDIAAAFYRRLKDNAKLLFDSAVEIAKKGDMESAFRIFEEADLTNVDTDRKEFYQIIGSSILSLFINGTMLDVSKIKEIYNSRIKKGLIESISVSGGKDSLELRIDFGNRKIRYSRQRVDGECRNDVSIFTQSGISDNESALKFYQDRTMAEAEAFWLSALEGKVPVERLVSSESFGNLRFNQIELCRGKHFERAGYKMLKKAIDISFDLYDAVNSAEKGKQHSSDYSLDYIAERVSQFGVDAKEIHAALKKEAKGIIHNDYAPRNLMVEDGKIVVIDHECYVNSNPVAMAVSLVYNPENNITDEERKELIDYARSKSPCSDEYLEAAKLLWLCRQARRCNPKSKEYKWYVGEMKR